MLGSIKSILQKIPIIRSIYARLRSARDAANGRKLFVNHEAYLYALDNKADGAVVLRTRDGLNITMRQNIWDGRIIREIFFDNPYVRHFTLPSDPVIVDIGGYIGDFSLYAVKYLNAKQVVVYEPTAENFTILEQNIANNGYAGRIAAINKAVSSSHEVALNIQKQEGEEVHVSAYMYQGAERRSLPSVTLEELMVTHNLSSVDLLKVDCEGGEYDIFPSVPDSVLKKIRNIAFEYHRIGGYEAKLKSVLHRLRSAGYMVRQESDIVYAYRQVLCERNHEGDA
jgi:FkbM family methyltransferase